MFMNMSPEFGRLKEPEEPGKERVKWLNNRELHTYPQRPRGRERSKTQKGEAVHNTDISRSRRMDSNSTVRSCDSLYILEKSY
jgi:hypothetical protein